MSLYLVLMMQEAKDCPAVEADWVEVDRTDAKCAALWYSIGKHEVWNSANSNHSTGTLIELSSSTREDLERFVWAARTIACNLSQNVFHDMRAMTVENNQAARDAAKMLNACGLIVRAIEASQVGQFVTLRWS